MITSTEPAATSGIGSWIGIADQSSLPSILRSKIGLGGVRRQLRSRLRCDTLRDDVLEQAGILEPEGRLAGLDGLLHQFLDAGGVQYLAAFGRVRHPVR